eukprot:3981987-Prymnesium_polylepis.1
MQRAPHSSSVRVRCLSPHTSASARVGCGRGPSGCVDASSFGAEERWALESHARAQPSKSILSNVCTSRATLASSLFLSALFLSDHSIALGTSVIAVAPIA